MLLLLFLYIRFTNVFLLNIGLMDIYRVVFLKNIIKNYSIKFDLLLHDGK